MLNPSMNYLRNTMCVINILTTCSLRSRTLFQCFPKSFILTTALVNARYYTKILGKCTEILYSSNRKFYLYICWDRLNRLKNAPARVISQNFSYIKFWLVISDCNMSGRTQDPRHSKGSRTHELHIGVESFLKSHSIFYS